MKNRSSLLFISLATFIAATTIACRPPPPSAFQRAVAAAKVVGTESSKGFIGGIGTGAAGVAIAKMKPDEKSKILVSTSGVPEEMTVYKDEYRTQLRSICYADQPEDPHSCIQIANDQFKASCVENCSL